MIWFVSCKQASVVLSMAALLNLCMSYVLCRILHDRPCLYSQSATTPVRYIPKILLQVYALVPPDGFRVNAALPQNVDMQTGVLLSNPSAPICEVGIASTLLNNTLELIDPSQPTSSPVAAVVQGSMELQIVNLQATDMQVRYLAILVLSLPY